MGDDLRVGYTATGDAVNLASRLRQATEQGTVLVTQDTQRLIAPLFETETLTPIEVMGRQEPVAVFRVLAPADVVGKGRGIPGLESPLVGREIQFHGLQEMLERVQVGVGGIATVVGEAGIGKSRLLAELHREAVPLNLRWLEARCVAYGTSMAYLLWVELLRELLGVMADASPATIRDALQAWVRALAPAHLDDIYPYLARMMSLPLDPEVEDRLQGLGGEGLKTLTFRAVETMVSCVAERSHLVLVCEDLHWADPTSLELLEHLLALTDSAAVLLICAFRPYRAHGSWRIREAAGRLYDHRHIDLRLSPLSPAETRALMGNLLHVDDLPQELRERILSHAEGNPLYVEEIIRSLIDDEAIIRDDTTGRWRATREIADIAIPDTLRGVLTSRIDRLPEEARRVLQIGSVVGRAFSSRVLMGMAATAVATGGEPALGQHLLTLQREQMLLEQARVPELEYSFRHHLTQEAAYNGLLRSERRILHRQAAEALEQLFPDRMEEQLGLLAHHWDRAGVRDKAIHYLRRAGEQAAAQFANTEAVTYLSRALGLTPKEDLTLRYELLLACEKIYDLQGAREAQMQSLATLESLAGDLQDDRKRAEVALRQSWYALVTGDYAAANAAAQAAVRLGRAARDLYFEAAGHLHLGEALWDQGEYEAARSSIEQSLELVRSAQTSASGSVEALTVETSIEALRSLEAEDLYGLGQVCQYLGDFDGASRYCKQALLIYRELGDRRGERHALFILANALLHQGEYDASRPYYEQCIFISREIGYRLGVAYSYLGLGCLLGSLGDYSGSRSCCEEFLSIVRDADNARGEGLALGWLGWISHKCADDHTAWEYCRQVLLIGQNTVDRYIQAWALTIMGHALTGLGLLNEAVDAYGEALTLRRELSQYYLANEPLAGLARVAQAQGDLPKAQAFVEEILTYLETGALQGPMEPFRVYLTCYRVLQTNSDPRAQTILEETYHLLQERAAKISDEGERRSFLENVTAHRELVSEYSRIPT